MKALLLLVSIAILSTPCFAGDDDEKTSAPQPAHSFQFVDARPIVRANKNNKRKFQKLLAAALPTTTNTTATATAPTITPVLTEAPSLNAKPHLFSGVSTVVTSVLSAPSPAAPSPLELPPSIAQVYPETITLRTFTPTLCLRTPTPTQTSSRADLLPVLDQMKALAGILTDYRDQQVHDDAEEQVYQNRVIQNLERLLQLSAHEKLLAAASIPQNSRTCLMSISPSQPINPLEAMEMQDLVSLVITLSSTNSNRESLSSKHRELRLNTTMHALAAISTKLAASIAEQSAAQQSVTE